MVIDYLEIKRNFGKFYRLKKELETLSLNEAQKLPENYREFLLLSSHLSGLVLTGDEIIKVELLNSEQYEKLKKREGKLNSALQILGKRYRELRRNYIVQKNFLMFEVGEDKQAHLPSLEIDYSLDSVDFEENKMTIILEIDGKEYSDFDISYFKKALAEKTFQETNIILASDEEIDKFEIDLSPFWVKKIPENFEKIANDGSFDKTTIDIT